MLHPGEGRGPIGKVEITESSASLPPSPNWAPAFAGVVECAARATALLEYYPNGASIDLGGSLNHFGPASVMWKQSSIRTPYLPGM